MFRSVDLTMSLGEAISSFEALTTPRLWARVDSSCVGVTTLNPPSRRRSRHVDDRRHLMFRSMDLTKSYAQRQTQSSILSKINRESHTEAPFSFGEGPGMGRRTLLLRGRDGVGVKLNLPSCLKLIVTPKQRHPSPSGKGRGWGHTLLLRRREGVACRNGSSKRRVVELATFKG